MSVNHSVKKSIALVLAGVAVAGATQIGTHAVDPGAVAAATSNHGNPRAVPPILPPARPADLAAIRSVEAAAAERFDYVPPTGLYSTAVFNGYGS